MATPCPQADHPCGGGAAHADRGDAWWRGADVRRDVCHRDGGTARRHRDRYSRPARSRAGGREIQRRAMPRIYLSPPDVGHAGARAPAAGVRRRLDRPSRARPRRLRGRGRRPRPAGRAPSPCRAGRRRCIWRCWCRRRARRRRVRLDVHVRRHRQRGAYCGANPVFIDSDAATWNMSPQLLGR